MGSKFETGHFKNLTNFSTLLKYVESQSSYAPDAMELKLESLKLFLKEMQEATNQLIRDSQAAQQIINDRQQTFAQVQKLVKRIMPYLESNITDEEAVKDVRTHYNQMQSKKVTKKDIINEDGSTSQKTFSNNRLSFTSVAEHFQNMVERLKSVPGYAPSEPVLKIESLEQLSNALHAANDNIAAAMVTVNNTRNLRDQLMYAKNTGLVDLAFRIKQYLKFKYGANSEQFAFAHNLKYTRKQIRINDPVPPNEPTDR